MITYAYTMRQNLIGASDNIFNMMFLLLDSYQFSNLPLLLIFFSFPSFLVPTNQSAFDHSVLPSSFI